MKYAPRKVYIKENNVYVGLSYRDFCRRRESDQRYMDKLFIPFYFMDGDMFGADSGGYLLMTKDKAVFYPQKNYLRINPDCTYYMEIDDETQIFSIKPFLTGDEEGIEISP